MPKFFINKESIINSKLLLTGADNNHIIKVLRKGIGDTLQVSDGEGFNYLIQISDINNDRIIAEILEKKVENCSDINITLYQSIPKSDKMDLIVQKCTELGVQKIVPFISERTVVIIDNKNQNKKVERWRRIAQESCKQCMRATIPNVSEIYSFDQVINSA
jgi:16S rRNA (uracil1498-N3)-methyltransferase